MNGPMLSRTHHAPLDNRTGDEHYLYHLRRSHGRRKSCDCRADDGRWWRRAMRRRESRFWRKEQDA